MAEYKSIKGFTVKNRTSDPLAGGLAGATWSSGGTMNTGRNRGYGTGTQTAALAAGGYAPSVTVNAEEYNGTSWSEQNNLPSGRGQGAAGGTQTAACLTGGQISDGTNEILLYDGTSFSTSPVTLNQARQNHAAAGTSTALLSFAGIYSPATYTGLTELFDGSSATEVADLNTGRGDLGGFGTSTAALAVGGNSPGAPNSALAESWNGTAWTEVGDLNTGRQQFASSGSQALGLVFGGEPPRTGKTEAWNGSSWTEVADLNVAVDENMGSDQGTDVTALSFGGNSNITNTEEWSQAGITDSIQNEGQVYFRSDTGDMKLTGKVFGTGAWSSSNVTNTKIGNRAFGGSQTAGLLAGGNPTANNMELYDGTSWTNSTVINTGRRALAGSGTVNTSVIIQGGLLTNPSALTEIWDGSSWTEVGDLNTARFYGATASQGSVTATLYAGGNAAATELWNGSSWSEVSDINLTRTAINGAGTSTAMIIAAGEAPAPPFRKAETEIWDGTSWTEVGDLNQLGIHRGMAGVSSSSALCFAGEIPPMTAKTEDWNGTSWTEVGDLAAARDLQQAGGGTSTAAIAAGSRTAPFSGATEEWNVPESISNLTITD
jgi:hypothetical protein